jgi:hypothetical protein
VVDMTETEEMEVGGYSKLTRISMIIVSMLLIFGGPTYVPYFMSKASIDATATAGVGAILFIVGIVFMMFLVNKKVITK